jgi:hypothetical protein
LTSLSSSSRLPADSRPYWAFRRFFTFKYSLRTACDTSSL